jgi:hybrid cluster-associated redox disulfide protein
MDTITTESNIGEILDQWPIITRIFIEYHMSCPGCYLSSFEILEDALKIYGIPVEQFISNLNRVIDIAE